MRVPRLLSAGMAGPAGGPDYPDYSHYHDWGVDRVDLSFKSGESGAAQWLRTQPGCAVAELQALLADRKASLPFHLYRLSDKAISSNQPGYGASQPWV